MSAQIFEANASGALLWKGRSMQCALGKAGVICADQKREGDNKSPLGDWPIRFLFYRADRIALPETSLPFAPTTPFDGWCDDSKAGTIYNKHILLPSPWSCEKLWRDDNVYDLVIVLGHNDAPARLGLGSAIFMHVKRGDYEGTEGCVALHRDDLLEIISIAKTGDIVRISPEADQAG